MRAVVHSGMSSGSWTHCPRCRYRCPHRRFQGLGIGDPANLLHALQAWKGGDPNDPGLMDRVEAILRGQAASAPGGVANLSF